MRTTGQAVIMDLLNDFTCLRRDQIERFMRINHGSNSGQVEHMLGQLRYLNEVMIKGDFVMLPQRRIMAEVIAAFDIMFEITAGTKLSVNPGEPPYILFYTIPGNESAGIYGVVYVSRGKELRIGARLKNTRDSGLTLIVILEFLEQQQYFAAVENVYFAIHDGTKYRYFTGSG